ncbi:hypothetical protein QFC20_007705 [Naganishia adeliensis]|uniref:Uncharacterized protein n=1 Tax=Naganishia adeliensis TaxID=92952 RepID=A0ACC2UX38_9TREE|nr:hypothetical protein QFC20_007705 [Naganishia adeliensis]
MTGQFTVSDGGLAQTLDQPIKFAHAWGWSVVLKNFKYHDPDLAAAMMRFGWKVMSYSLSNDWTICLRVVAELPTPPLRGNLLQVKERFDTSFMQSASSFGNTVAHPGTTSQPSAVNHQACRQARESPRMPLIQQG